MIFFDSFEALSTDSHLPFLTRNYQRNLLKIWLKKAGCYLSALFPSLSSHTPSVPLGSSNHAFFATNVTDIAHISFAFARHVNYTNKIRFGKLFKY